MADSVKSLIKDEVNNIHCFSLIHQASRITAEGYEVGRVWLPLHKTMLSTPTFKESEMTMSKPKGDCSCTMLWNKYRSVIWKDYYYCMQEKKKIMKDFHAWLRLPLLFDSPQTCIILFPMFKINYGLWVKKHTYSKFQNAHRCHPDSHHPHHSASDPGYSAYCYTETVQLCTTVVALLHV